MIKKIILFILSLFGTESKTKELDEKIEKAEKKIKAIDKELEKEYTSPEEALEEWDND